MQPGSRWEVRCNPDLVGKFQPSKPGSSWEVSALQIQIRIPAAGSLHNMLLLYAMHIGAAAAITAAWLISLKSCYYKHFIIYRKLSYKYNDMVHNKINHILKVQLLSICILLSIITALCFYSAGRSPDARCKWHQCRIFPDKLLTVQECNQH